MARAVSVFSTSTITPDGLAKVLAPFHVKNTPDGWQLARSGRSVFIEIDTIDLPEVPEDILRPVAELLKDWPRSSVALMFDDTLEDNFEARMAKAVAIAMSEHWPIVYTDYYADPEIIRPSSRTS